MAAGLIYGKSTGRLRRAVTGYTSAADIAMHVGPGEGVLVLNDTDYAAITDLQAYVTAATGITPSNDRAVMIDPVGQVRSIHIADPGCDLPFPGQTLVWHAQAQPGWLYENRLFREYPPSRRVFTQPRRLGARPAPAQ